MTQRFKDAVKAAVLDGEITPSERELLKKIAKEDGIPELDAETYIMAEYKKRKKEMENDSSFWETVAKIGGGVITAVGTVLSIFQFLETKENNAHRRKMDLKNQK